MADEWIEYDCPLTGVDADISPIPPYGEAVYCTHCGRDHAMTLDIADAYRMVDGQLACINDEWAAVG